MRLSSDKRKYKLKIMAKEKERVGRKLFRSGGWALARRASKSIPYVGTVMAVGLVGFDIRRKGVMFGVANSTIDAIPFVGFAKNSIEMLTGDFFPDKPAGSRKKK